MADVSEAPLPRNKGGRPPKLSTLIAREEQERQATADASKLDAWFARWRALSHATAQRALRREIPLPRVMQVA